jgi:multicomponent Na+:H+ antiporter subunit E
MSSPDRPTVPDPAAVPGQAVPDRAIIPGPAEAGAGAIIGPGAPSRLRTLAQRWRGALGEFVILFGFWLLLSDQWRPLFLAMGAISAATVTALTYRIVATVLYEPGGHPLSWLRRVGWFVVFVGWMLYSIAAASIQLAFFALHLGRPFQPRFVTFETQLERPLSRVILAVAITLVPGTMTVRLMGHRYLVHTLIPGSADDLTSGRMQTMVARITGEAAEPPPEMHWGPIIEEAVR